MINSMPDDAVSILVEFLKRMMAAGSYSDNPHVSGDTRIPQPRRKLGIANGMYNIPDNIDACNDEIAQMFGVSE